MDIKILKAYKLQLDSLGYIASNGECKGVELYRAGLRSGKTEQQPLNSGSRVFQYNRFLSVFFSGSKSIKANPTYKAVILNLVYPLTLKGRSHSKAIQSLGSTLEKRKYITITSLLEGGLLNKR